MRCQTLVARTCFSGSRPVKRGTCFWRVCGRPLDRWVIYASNATRAGPRDIVEIYGEFGVYTLSEFQPTAFSQSNARNHVGQPREDHQDDTQQPSPPQCRFSLYIAWYVKRYSEAHILKLAKFDCKQLPSAKINFDHGYICTEKQ